MKRFLAFMGVFVTVLLIGYLEPVFFPAEPSVETVQNGGQTVSHTALPHEDLESSGYSKYIDKNAAEFIREFGEPDRKQATGFDYELWFYQQSDDLGHLEISVKNQKIMMIKVLDETSIIEPFKIGMDLTDVSELTTIYSNFEFEYKEQTYAVELMEEDMNYRPLIAFDNETFAVLFFSQGTNRLVSVVYLNKEALLLILPYQLIEGQSQTIAASQTSEAEKNQPNLFTSTINFLRTKEELPVYRVSESAQKNAVSLFQTIQKEIPSQLADERLDLWTLAMEEKSTMYSFTLTNEEYEALVKSAQLSQKQVTGIYTLPVYDSSFTVLLWFSDALYHSRLANDESQEMGIAFSQESVLVLIQDQDINKETSQTTKDSE